MSGTVRSRLHPDFQGESGKQLEGAAREGDTQREANQRAAQGQQETIQGEPESSQLKPEDSQPERQPEGQDTQQAPENTEHELEAEWRAWQETLRARQSASPRGGP